MMVFPAMMVIPTPVSVLEKIMQIHPLCDACLGRLYRPHFQDLTNKERGADIRAYFKLDVGTEAVDCWLCEGLTDEIAQFCTLACESLNDYEFDSFLVGSRVDDDVIARQHQLEENLEISDAEPVKMELNRRIGKQLSEMLDKQVDFSNPDIVVVVDTSYDVVHLQIKSLYLYGRYRKLVRGIPQTRWPCRVCRGKGCRKCEFTGKMYPSSVEELIAAPVEKKLMARNYAFHGSGREDIDALMLGTGRPFVLEIKNPKKRTLDFRSITKEINTSANGQIEIEKLRLSDKDEIVRLKNADFRKTYRVTLEAASILEEENLKKGALALRGATIRQFTPIRVAHRRAHKIRERTIYRINIESVKDTRAQIVLETESGTYIKELISGDNGRTQPNISDLIGIPCIVKELDVIDIKGE
jgi:tRNA pseudouridine synthase 10